MGDVYEAGYQSFAQEIRLYSPKTASVLDQIHLEHRVQVAFYAAFVILCLEMHLQNLGHRYSDDKTDLKVGSSTFMQVTKDNPKARALFQEALLTYRRDYQSRFAARLGDKPPSTDTTNIVSTR